jgi:2-dehydropantoate 2-reductase
MAEGLTLGPCPHRPWPAATGAAYDPLVAYVVVGAGAIGGVIGAQLVRDGHDVLLCDADAEHVAAIRTEGFSIEGPVETYRVAVPAVSPAELPDDLDAVLLAVKAHHTRAALEAVAPRLARDGYVVSLQNGVNEPLIGELVGPERVVGAVVNFGADVVAPGHILRGNRASILIGELDGRPSERVAGLVRDIEDAEATDRILGFLWSKLAYGAMLIATAVSDLAIADALAEPRYRPLFVALARAVGAVAPVPLEPLDGLDPTDLEGSLDRLVAFNRGSAKTHSGVYRDLAVRRRPTEVAAILEPLLPSNTVLQGNARLVSLTLELITAIEAGGRTCDRANLELLAAHERLERLGRPLNAVLAPLPPAVRRRDGPLAGIPVAVKDNVDIEGSVTTNASAVGVPPPAAHDAPAVARLRAAGAELLCKANLLEYAAGSVSPAYGMTLNPLDPTRTAGGSSSGSAALVAAGVCDHALGTDTGGSIRIPAAYCGIVGLKPTAGLLPVAGVFPLSPTLDTVGTLTRTVAQTAELLEAITGRPLERRSPDDVRVGVVAAQLADPDLDDVVRRRVVEAIAALGLPTVEVELPDGGDEILGTIVLYEAWQVHRTRYESEADGYGPGTRALLEDGSAVTHAQYREALAARERYAARMAELFGDADVLAGPTVAFPAPAEDPPFDSPAGALEARFTGPYNLAGVPAVSVPCGAAEGRLPAGLQLAAACGEDALLLAVAARYDAIAGPTSAPRPSRSPSSDTAGLDVTNRTTPSAGASISSSSSP